MKEIFARFLENEGGKEVLKSKTLQTFAWMILAMVLVLKSTQWSVDTSFITKSVLPFFGMGEEVQDKSENIEPSEPLTNSQKTVWGVGKKETPTEQTKIFSPKKSPPPIRYAAKQVIVRGGSDGLNALPIGASAVGKTLNGIDTRNDGGTVRVLLPYGMSFKGTQKIPKGSVLLGSVTYQGSGDKLFIRFNKGLLPNGREFPISAEALNPKDFSAGLTGEHHDNADTRMATALGLSAVSTASNVLVKRESLGYEVHPESTFQNAMLSAFASTSEAEARRKAQGLGANREYITLEAGIELVVSLTEWFK